MGVMGARRGTVIELSLRMRILNGSASKTRAHVDITEASYYDIHSSPVYPL